MHASYMYVATTLRAGGSGNLHVVWPALNQNVEQQHCKYAKLGVWGHVPPDKFCTVKPAHVQQLQFTVIFCD